MKISEGGGPVAVCLGRLVAANSVYVQFERLAEFVDDAWITSKSNGIGNRQLVNASPAAVGPHKVKGSVWSFEMSGRGAGNEKPMAVRPKRAMPVIDLSGEGLDEARRMLTVKGVDLPKHQGRQALVLLEGGICCLLKFEAHGSTWRVKTSEGPVLLHPSDPRWSESGRVAGHLWLPDVPELPPALRSADWATDGEFLTRLTDRIRSAIRWTAAETLQAPKERVDATVAEADRWIAADDELQATLERLRADWPRLARAGGAMEGIYDLLARSEEGRGLLQEAASRLAERSRAAMEASLRAELQFSTKAACEELEALRGEVRDRREAIVELERSRDVLRNEVLQHQQEIRAELDRLKRARNELAAVQADTGRERLTCDHAKAEAERLEARAKAAEAAERDARKRVDRLCHDLDRTLQAAEGDAPALTALVADLGALLHETLPGAQLPVAPPGGVPPWWGTAPRPVEAGSSASLHDRLVEEARAHGVLRDDLLILDAMARAGELVVLTGDFGRLAIDAYARAVSGGVVRMQGLDPSFMGLDDLWRMPSTGKPTAFAAAWHRATARPDETIVACLCDLDSSPIHLWLASLHGVLAGSTRPPNLLLFALPGACPSTGAAYPASDALRARAVFLHPRPDPAISLPEVTVGALARPTSLALPPVDARQLPDEDLFHIATEGKAHAVVARATRFRAALESTAPAQRQLWARAWTAHLRTGSCSELPDSIARGTEDSASLNFRN